MASEKKLSRTGRIRAWTAHVYTWLRLKISRWRYGSIDPAFELRELHLLERLKPGQLAYCEMPFSDWTLASIPEGHRCRPYLILGRTEEGIIAAPASHKPRKGARWAQLHLRSKDHPDYLFFGDQRRSYTDSWISLAEPAFIPEAKILSRTISLNQTDLVLADRILAALHGRGRLKTLFHLQQGTRRVQPGDILSRQSQCMLVSSCADQTVYGYVLTPVSKDAVPALRIEAADGRVCGIAHPALESRPADDAGTMISFCTTEQLIGLEQQITALKAAAREKERKQKSAALSRPSELSWHGQSGELFVFPWAPEEYVYLFSRYSEDYFVSMESYYDNQIQLVKKPLRQMEPVCELMDPETFQEILDRLVRGHQISRKIADMLYTSFLQAWNETEPE